MNDVIYVNELLRRLKTTHEASLFEALFVLYIHRYRQVHSNTFEFSVIEKVPFSLLTGVNGQQ